jgi:hypothetical protein
VGFAKEQRCRRERIGGILKRMTCARGLHRLSWKKNIDFPLFHKKFADFDIADLRVCPPYKRKEGENSATFHFKT